MPLGASITFGTGSSDLSGYRKPLLEKAWAQGKELTFVGNMQSGPDRIGDRPFPRANEGHSGYLIQTVPGHAGILELTGESLRLNKPNIVLVFVGTNDAVLDYEIAQVPNRMGLLLDTIADNAPDALVVLSKLTLTRNDDFNVRIRSMNASMDRLVEERSAKGRHIVLVDMQEAFTRLSPDWKTAFLTDDLHPNDAGFAVMSGYWYEAIGHLLRP